LNNAILYAFIMRLTVEERTYFGKLFKNDVLRLL